jgi:hypothetical protein
MANFCNISRIHVNSSERKLTISMFMDSNVAKQLNFQKQINSLKFKVVQ